MTPLLPMTTMIILLCNEVHWQKGDNHRAFTESTAKRKKYCDRSQQTTLKWAAFFFIKPELRFVYIQEQKKSRNEKHY